MLHDEAACLAQHVVGVVAGLHLQTDSLRGMQKLGIDPKPDSMVCALLIAEGSDHGPAAKAS